MCFANAGGTSQQESVNRNLLSLLNVLFTEEGHFFEGKSSCMCEGAERYMVELFPTYTLHDQECINRFPRIQVPFLCIYFSPNGNCSSQDFGFWI
jgi:hypothetical protein